MAKLSVPACNATCEAALPHTFASDECSVTCKDLHVGFSSGLPACVPGKTFGCRRNGGSASMWVAGSCHGWFVLDGVQRYICSTTSCRFDGIGNEDPVLKPTNPVARTLASASARPVMDTELLSLMQERPEFSRVTLVHVDPNTHHPNPLAHNWSLGNGSSQPRRQLHFVYNPSVLDYDNIFVKVAPFAHCSLGSTKFTLANRVLKGSRWVVWIHRRAVRAVIAQAEDPFALRLSGQIHLLFARRRSHSSVIHLAQLEPGYREIPLNYSSMRVWEKNWAPFVYENSLYVAYKLCPYRVLRCDTRTGECVDTPAADARRPISPPPPPPVCMGLSGSGPMVQYDSEHLLGVAHITSHLPSSRRWAWGVGIDRHYVHRFYIARATPPFALVGLSQPFHFPRFFQSELDLVQFCAGMAIEEDAGAASSTVSGGANSGDNGPARSVAISYGVADCVALSVRLPLTRVVQLTLAGDNVAATRRFDKTVNGGP